MRAEKKRMTIILGIIVLLLLCAIVPAFALLIHDTNIDFNTEFGEIPADATDFSAQSLQTFIFTHAGESHDLELKVSNNADKPVSYSYEITVPQDAQGLENAIFVYFDGEFLGTLAAAKKSPIVISSTNYLLKGKVGELADSVNHTLSFQLHNGAESSTYQNMEFKATVTLLAGTINYQNNIMVSSYEDLVKAVDDVMYSARSISIRMTNDIELLQDVTLMKACDIDLMGHKFIFNGNKLIMNFTEIDTAKIFSSRGDVPSSEHSGIEMRGDKTALIFGQGASSYQSAVTIMACDMQAAESLMMASLKSSLGSGVVSGASLTLLDGLMHYIGSGKVTLVKQYGDYTLSGVNIASAAIPRTQAAALKVGEQIIEFKLLGQDAEAYVNIINSKFEYLDMLTVGNNANEVDFDLYLPGKFEDINASVTYQSLNPNILSDKGICGDSVEGLATIIATVNINGATITKSMTFSILKQSNQMRFDYLVARIGEQNLSALYDMSMPNGSYFVLPIVQQGSAEDYRAMYSMRSLGLENLTYELSATFNYLSMLDTANRVHLVEPTLDTYAEILIKGKFSNERDREYISTIGVQIKTLDNEKLHQQILDYIQMLLNKVDILQNTLDTRAMKGMALERGDFTLPSEYKGFDLTYTSNEALFSDIQYIPATDIEVGKCLFMVDLSKLTAKSGSAVINASIRIKGATDESLTTISPMKVNTPPALVVAQDGIADINLFNSIKIQTIQQLLNEDGTLQDGVPGISESTIDDELSLKGYILMYDALQLKKLIIRTGDYVYGNTAQKKAYDIDTRQYYYSVNDFAEVYEGLALLNNIAYLAINNNAQLFKGDDAAKSQLSGALMDMLSSEYKALTHLEMTNAYLSAANQTLKLNGLIHLDLMGNIMLNNMEFLCERSNNTLNYLDISGTGYDYKVDLGVLAALYYRHTVLGGNAPPQWYYTDNGVRTLYVNDDTESGLEACFYLYNLAVAKDIITSMAAQLKWGINTNSLGYLKIEWSLTSGSNYAGLSIGAILVDTASSKIRLSNNLLGTQKPPDGRLFEDCKLNGSVTYIDAQSGGVTRSISRVFKLKLAY